jgi:hypothetical protein
MSPSAVIAGTARAPEADWIRRARSATVRRGTTAPIPEEDTMTEQPDTPQPSGDDQDASRAGSSQDPARPGGGRTQGETTVDDALGQGDA